MRLRKLLFIMLSLSTVFVLYTLTFFSIIIPINEWPGQIDFNDQGERLSLVLNLVSLSLSSIYLVLYRVLQKPFDLKSRITFWIFLVLLVSGIQLMRLMFYFSYEVASR